MAGRTGAADLSEGCRGARRPGASRLGLHLRLSERLHGLLHPKRLDRAVQFQQCKGGCRDGTGAACSVHYIAGPRCRVECRAPSSGGRKGNDRGAVQHRMAGVSSHTCIIALFRAIRAWRSSSYVSMARYLSQLRICAQHRQTQKTRTQPQRVQKGLQAQRRRARAALPPRVRMCENQAAVPACRRLLAFSSLDRSKAETCRRARRAKPMSRRLNLYTSKHKHSYAAHGALSTSWPAPGSS